MTAFNIMFCIGSILAGLITDRFGAKRVMVSGLFLGSVAAFLFTLTRDFTLMVIYRAILGWGAASLLAPGITFILSWLPKEKSNIGISLMNVSVTVGVGVTFLLTPILAPIYKWNYLLRIYAILGVAVALIFGALAKTRKVVVASSGPEQLSEGEKGLLQNPLLLFTGIGLFLRCFNYMVFTLGSHHILVKSVN